MAKGMTHSSQKLKVVLFIPNSRWFGKRPWIILPHAPLILTALLKNDFDFRLLDANIYDLSEEECKLRLQEINPAFVLCSGFSAEYHQHYHKAMELAKSACSDAITVLGGVYPTVLGEEAIKDSNIDYIFIGHAEERLCDFLHLAFNRDAKLKDFSGIGFRDESRDIMINPVKSYRANLKKVVKPDYSLFDVDSYLNQKCKDYQFNTVERTAIIITSYGCPHNCLFCAARTINGRGVVYRPAEDVLEEIEFLKTSYDVKHLVFLDDYFLGNRLRIHSILNAFIERRYNLSWKAANVSAWHLDDELLALMKKSGCTQITVSVESGSQRVLNKVIRKPLKLEIIPGIVKKCKELNIDIGANFVIGLPDETWDELRRTFYFAEHCDFDLVHFHIATPLPKTDLYTFAKERGLIPPDFSFTDARFFGFCQGFITTEEFTPFELMVLRAFEWDRINFSSAEKTAKVAKMMNLSIEELDQHRKQTRLKCGIHFSGH